MTDYNTETRRLPRWIQIAGLTIAILAILGVLMMVLLGGGEHGPSRHGDNNTPATTSQATPHPPEGTDDGATQSARR